MKLLTELILLALVGLGLIFGLGVRADEPVAKSPVSSLCVCIPDDNGDCVIVCGDE